MDVTVFSLNENVSLECLGGPYFKLGNKKIELLFVSKKRGFQRFKSIGKTVQYTLHFWETC